MKSTTPGSTNRRHSRPYRAAPPILHAEDAAEGSEILTELPGPASVLVRAALRDLMLWLETPMAARGALFPPGAGTVRTDRIRAAHAELDRDLWTPLFTLAALAEQPLDPDTTRLLYACRRIASWADEHGKAGTRLAFAQASAILRPQDPSLAIEVARLARDAGQHARAESWFRNAITLARGRDWESYVWAFVGLGVLYIRCGNWPAAQIVMSRALRSARRRKLRPLEGVSHHHLFHLATEANRLAEAYQHVREAVDAYGRDHPSLPGLVADVGRFWVHLGRFDRAMPMFEAALEHIADPNIRAMIGANVVRAAGALGDRARYESARVVAEGLLVQAPGPDRLADAYEALAHGDLSMAEWERANAAAREALALATATSNAEVRLIAEAQIECAERRLPFTPRPKGTETPGVARQADRLAEDLSRAVATGS